jgi:short-subunit dehydrogenase
MASRSPAVETALITGASSGIGFELARCFAADGIDLVLVARNLERLRHTAETLEARHRIRITTVAADLSRPEAPDEIRDAAESREIAIDYLVNNAGVGVHGSFQDTRLEDELAMMRLNMDAMVGLTKLFLPGMLRQKSGRILNLASLAGCQPGGPGAAVYYATKSFVLSFSRGLNEELRGTGVSVTALCPGSVDTHFHETGEFARTPLYSRFLMSRPEAVAKAGYRAMKKKKEVCVPGFLAKVLAFGGQLPPRRLALEINRMLLRPRHRFSDRL